MPSPPKTLKDARRAMFTTYGHIALESVITGRISHSKAVSSLQALRDLVMEPEGPRKKSRIKQYLADHKMLKDTDLSYFESYESRED